MTVTTIDFDIVMAPSIEGYNDLISEEEGMNQLCKKYPFFNNADIDLYIYEYLTRFITAITKKGLKPENIYFISTHDLAFDICDKIKEPFELINIDHHHDINYSDNGWKHPVMEPDASDWVKALFDRGKVSKYTWVGNPNSEMYDFSKCTFEDKVYRYTLRDFPMSDLENETDILICCFSEQYIPTKYQPLFLVWRAIVEEQYDKDFLIIDNKENI